MSVFFITYAIKRNVVFRGTEIAKYKNVYEPIEYGNIYNTVLLIKNANAYVRLCEKTKEYKTREIEKLSLSAGARTGE